MEYRTVLNSFWIIFILSSCCVIIQTEAVCTFPSDLQNKNWTSTIFGDMMFETRDVNFTVTVFPTTLESWSCHTNSGNKYVIQYTLSVAGVTHCEGRPYGFVLIAPYESAVKQSKESGLVFGISSYFYYCLDLRRQGTDSYLFYLQSVEDGGQRLFTANVNTTVALSDVCTETLDTAEYHVMINSASPTTVKYSCATPLLADFTYQCAPDNGTLSVCPNQKTFTFNNTVCSPTDKVLFSDGGELNCIATTSTTISGDTVFYQTLYNTDTNPPDGVNTFQFVCLAVTKYNNGTVIFSAEGTECTPGQTATTNTLYTLTITDECPLTTASTDSGSNTGLIIGIVVGLIILLIIIAIIIYCCFFKKDPNAGKPIVENTKPRFEDPDKEDIIEDLELVDTMGSPVTRDEITFEAMSPSIISNGRLGHGMAMSPTKEVHGGYVHNGTANGSLRRDSGIAMTEKSMDRPTPRMGLNQTRDAMVIFNGDEKVISGNDTRIVPNENPNARTIQMDTSDGGTLTLHGLEDDEELDALGELSPTDRSSLPFPSLPRSKSNLMPPNETSDPVKEPI